MAQLTFHACNDLRNQNNDPDILISTPVVHVVGFRELPTLRTLSDVEIKYEMTVADGSEDTMDLVLRADFSIGGFAYDGSPLEGSTIKLQHMIRIPSGTNQSDVLVKDFEVMTPQGSETPELRATQLSPDSEEGAQVALIEGEERKRKEAEARRERAERLKNAVTSDSVSETQRVLEQIADLSDSQSMEE